ncbi:hypothetical protein OIU79_021694 [Salix purpurea]|uniref:Uncharacterized protein n=1 Tax=Salix purpurea TaxID=77065 RepID=A0A9Q0WH46_SALPP|nr:hypothetical protein OIU79_021694 [Salix purpurea]
MLQHQAFLLVAIHKRFGTFSHSSQGVEAPPLQQNIALHDEATICKLSVVLSYPFLSPILYKNVRSVTGSSPGNATTYDPGEGTAECPFTGTIRTGSDIAWPR